MNYGIFENSVGVAFLYRPVSTGKPTKKHIVNDETGNALCGWNDWFAQIYHFLPPPNIDDCCKKCLKIHNKK